MTALARALITLAIPVLLVLLAVLAVPADGPTCLGIGLRIWALFACAPATSAWLWWRQRAVPA
ncbi:hypothetical protein IP65_10590 [Novosphingobium sp. AAP1]|uniref:hypothetical protein n=1 Tax=Novosphingobium sp. AAP1 TaxID=1523413 RepID=UPI0006BA0AA6|nr:hypothetical protein [Novosphingobium sp. AAP1]KPF54204.1 hypothetical protein IP65_10590 [Novosphingobium sp. AAP1]